MKIGVKITLISVSAVIALLICFYVGHTRVNELSDMFTYCGDVPITNSDTASSVLLDLNAIARNSAISILYSKNDPEKAVNYIKNCNYLAATMTRKMDYLKERASKGEGQKLIGELITAVKIADEARTNMQRLMTNGNWDEATKIRTGKYAILLENALTAGQAYCDFTTKQSLTYCYVDSNNHAADADFWLTITTIIAAIVLACISIAVIVGTTKPLKQAVEAAEKIAMGDFNVNLETHSKDETGLLLCSMTKMVTSVNAMSYDIGAAIHNTLEGNLKFRADATKHKGNYKDMISALNGLIEAFIEPIEICATAFDHIAIGSDKLAEVTIECKGDFNNIKNSINTAVKTLYTVLGEFNKAGVAAGQGDLSKRADVSKVSGAWTNMLESLNTIMASAESVINDASRALEIMATGDLTPRITNNYVGKFNDIKNYINNLGDSLTDLISQLQTAIHTTASASAEISSTADSLAAATQQQSTQTGEVASAMEEMARTVTDNAQSASRTADVARKSGDIATVGGKVVEQTVNKMREIADVVQLSATNIVKLGESSQKIGEIISVIDDIADQTNLLSLNAAIEAARAGEQGRGFAVVADSVGKLAVSTASATKEIADMIKGIQIDTDAAVVAMEKGTSEVKSGIELADNAGNSIQNILFGINELLDMINQIAAASEQQSATSEQISNNVTLMSKVTAGSAKSIEDVAATANELANMTETLTALVAQFKTDTGAPHALPLRSATALASL